MANDIVTRLRDNASHLRRIGYTADGDEIAEAADEIERLRQELIAYKAAFLMLKGHSEDCLADFGDEPCTCGYENKMHEYELQMGIETGEQI